jgi:tetratricopeptide (TPR) repeat protein
MARVPITAACAIAEGVRGRHPSHLALRHVVNGLVLALVAGSGCRLIPRSGPVPQEVADARRLCNEGLSAADRKDLLRAEGLLEQAVKNCPTDVDARRHYADVLWQRGERMAAVTQIAEALRLSPGDTSLCIDGGRMYMELGLLDDADRLSREAVRVAPRSEKAWRLHGQVAQARGRPEEALADYHRALAIAPDDRELILDTAEIYRRLGRPQRALATLAILGESYPPNQTPPQVLALEGMAQEALDRPTDAIESYRQAVARGLESQDVVARLAKLEQAGAEGRPQTAIAETPAGVSRQ